MPNASFPGGDLVEIARARPARPSPRPPRYTAQDAPSEGSCTLDQRRRVDHARHCRLHVWLATATHEFPVFNPRSELPTTLRRHHIVVARGSKATLAITVEAERLYRRALRKTRNLYKLIGKAQAIQLQPNPFRAFR